MKYRRTEIVEAVQLSWGTWKEVRSFLPEKFCGGLVLRGCNRIAILVNVDGCDVLAEEGDYIVKDENGKFFPCKKDVFEAMYEAVKEEFHLSLPMPTFFEAKANRRK